MTETQKRFVELERKKEEVNKFFEELATATEAVAKETGVGSYFQDEQGIVYKVVVPEGKFVHFEKLSCLRTRRPHEKAGTLSMKEAEAAGYRLPERG